MWQDLPFLGGVKREGNMHAISLDDFLRFHTEVLVKGPIAILGVEDEVELDTTIRHLHELGFAQIIALMPPEMTMSRDVETLVVRIDHVLQFQGDLVRCVNRLQKAAPKGTWMHYCFNTEFLFFPFCETRSIGEMLAFHSEERRTAMLTFVVDLYSDDLNDFPDAVSLERAHMDRVGYYALARPGPPHGHPKERQLDFFGGLRWRFEEHVPAERRRIDRISLFQSDPAVTLRDDYTFDREEMNTYACPWHNNLTAAVCSFRTAKALKLNPGSRYDIETFKWHNSAPFEWHSRQLLDLGLMEPGQWF